MSSFINLLDVVYPIGTYYISESDTSPSTLFGGTWSQVKGKYLKTSSTLAVGSEGGSTSHNHEAGSLSAAIGAVNDFPHVLGYIAGGISGPSSGPTYVVKGADYERGNGQKYNHYTAVYGYTAATDTEPPYRVVNMWYRTA